MTADQILRLLTAAASTLAEAIRVAEEARAALSEADRGVLDGRLQALISQNEAAFARVDARLKAIETAAGAGRS